MVALLAHDSPSLQAAAAYVLGTAASNNHKFLEELMQSHPESITVLMQVRGKHAVNNCSCLLTMCMSSVG